MAYSYATWSPDLKSGNAVVDNQHKQLISIVNELYDTQKHGKASQAVWVMKFLLEYTARHFAAEEALQKKHNYPDYAGHKQRHDEFRHVARGLAKRLAQEGPTGEFIDHICVTVGRWVMNHIKADDLKMIEYIRNKKERQR
jgi:hemerythrin